MQNIVIGWRAGHVDDVTQNCFWSFINVKANKKHSSDRLISGAGMVLRSVNKLQGSYIQFFKLILLILLCTSLPHTRRCALPLSADNSRWSCIKLRYDWPVLRHVKPEPKHANRPLAQLPAVQTLLYTHTWLNINVMLWSLLYLNVNTDSTLQARWVRWLHPPVRRFCLLTSSLSSPLLHCACPYRPVVSLFSL